MTAPRWPALRERLWARWEALVAPPASLPPDARRIARSMAVIMFGLVPVYGVCFALSASVRVQPLRLPEIATGVVLPGGAALAVVVARRGRPHLGAWLLAATDLAGGFWVALLEHEPLRALASVFFVLTGVVFASYLMSVRSTVIVALLAAAILPATAAVHPSLRVADTVLPLALLVLVSSVLAMGSHLRAEHVREIEARTREAADHAERLHVTMDSCLDAVVTTDAALHVLEWSRQAERIFGRPRADAVGRDLREMIAPPGQSDRLLACRDGDESAPGGPFELQARDAAGRLFPVEVSCFALELMVCPLCGGQRRVIAAIEKGAVAKAILECLGLPTEPPPRAAARGPPQGEFDCASAPDDFDQRVPAVA